MPARAGANAGYAVVNSTGRTDPEARAWVGGRPRAALGALSLSAAARGDILLGPMDSPSEQKGSGMMDELKGKVKQAVGDLKDDSSMHAEGQADETKGKMKQAAGDARKAIDDLLD